MKGKSNITDKQLAFLEDYIKRKKVYFETEERLELIDHLICDFEENGNGNISEFLANKSSFIFNYKSSRKESVHWAYQKELWKIFFSFFTHLKTIPLVLFIVVLFYELINRFSEKTVSIIFILFIIVPTVFGLIKTYHKKKEVRSLIEFKYLANIMALPNIFLYVLAPFREFWFSNKWIALTYLSIGVFLNFAGMSLILNKRKRIFKKYSHLLR